MSVNETVNQSQSPPAGGSGDSPEKLVADHVDRLWEHIAADGYDLLADVAVESLTRNGDVPPDAYLRAVKMSWCLHRAAVHYARQYSVERVSADFARGDAQFEHSLRAQAERKAEKLEADLAQSALLVENLRLRLDEADTANQELRQKLDTAEAALLEQQQQKRELRNEEQSVQALWGETRRRCEDLETLVADLQTANAAAEAASAAAEAALLEQQQRNEELVTQNSHQFMKIAELQRQVEGVKTQELEGKTQELPAGYTPPEGWRVVRFGEELLPGDVWVNWEGTVSRPDILHGDGTRASGGRYIRRIKQEQQTESEPEPVQVREGRWKTRNGEIRNVTPTPAGDGREHRFPWWDAQYRQTWAEDGRYHVRGESPLDLVKCLGPIEPQPEPQPPMLQDADQRG